MRDRVSSATNASIHDLRIHLNRTPTATVQVNARDDRITRSRRSLESVPDANDDRERQPGAVVIDRGQARSDELIDVGQTADVTQSELRVEVDLLRNREQYSNADTPCKRRSPVVEVAVLRDEIRLRCREHDVDSLDVRDANRALHIHTRIR